MQTVSPHSIHKFTDNIDYYLASISPSLRGFTFLFKNPPLPHSANNFQDRLIPFMYIYVHPKIPFRIFLALRKLYLNQISLNKKSSFMGPCNWYTSESGQHLETKHERYGQGRYNRSKCCQVLTKGLARQGVLTVSLARSWYRHCVFTILL